MRWRVLQPQDRGGTKIEADASRHKAMSYGYMLKELARLEEEVEQLPSQAESHEKT